MREIGLALLGCKDELSAERTTKQLLYDENESLRKTLEAHSLLDTAKFPPQQQQQQQRQQQQQQRLIESSSSSTLSSIVDVNSDLKSSADSNKTFDSSSKSSERQLLKKVVQLNENCEKLSREKDRLTEEILRVNEAQERDAIAWRDKEADLESRLEAALERANATRLVGKKRLRLCSWAVGMLFGESKDGGFTDTCRGDCFLLQLKASDYLTTSSYYSITGLNSLSFY